ncbi:MAG: hypothetical protein AAGH78_11400 [Cyanobacteria bacterium P01_H01_bin.58]
MNVALVIGTQVPGTLPMLNNVSPCPNETDDKNIRRPLWGCIVLNLQEMSTPFWQIDRLISVMRDRYPLHIA